MKQTIHIKSEKWTSTPLEDNKTLFNDVKQLRAGQLLTVDVINIKYKFQTKRYYTFSHEEPKQFSEERLRKKLAGTNAHAMKRLMKIC